MTLVAHQFEDAHQQHEAATLGMWTFLATEVLFFGGLFISYAVYRHAYPTAFQTGSHELKEFLGAINTAVLLTSSLTVALAVHFLHQHRRAATILCILATMALGIAFLGIKATEYAIEYHDHLIPAINFHTDAPDANHVQLFFIFYFFMTLLHATHMVIGLGLMAYLVLEGLKAGRFVDGKCEFRRSHRPLLALRRPRLDLSLSASVPGEIMEAVPKTTLTLPRLMLIYLALMALLALTVVANALPLGSFGLVVALTIAGVKSLLVVLFFMHVKYESRSVWIFAATSLLWLSILFGLTFTDYLSRSWLSRTDGLPPHVSACHAATQGRRAGFQHDSGPRR